MTTKEMKFKEFIDKFQSCPEEEQKKVLDKLFSAINGMANLDFSKDAEYLLNKALKYFRTNCIPFETYRKFLILKESISNRAGRTAQTILEKELEKAKNEFTKYSIYMSEYDASRFEKIMKIMELLFKGQQLQIRDLEERVFILQKKLNNSK